jgi:hypothetical protein
VEAGEKAPPRNLTSVVDWLDSLIGPGGLLLLVSDIRAIPVLVLWVWLETLVAFFMPSLQYKSCDFRLCLILQSNIWLCEEKKT